MSWHERSIKVAFDSISGEVIEAYQVFDTAKNGFIVRTQFHRSEIVYIPMKVSHHSGQSEPPG